MKPFEFYNPVRIVFGPGEMARLGQEAIKYGKTVLLVKSAGPLEKTGVYKRAIDLLEDAGLKVFHLDGVAANPKLHSVKEGIEICRQNSIDIVIAVGGGSPIDCAKAIAMGAVEDDDIWDFFTQKRTATKSLPIGVVSTIAATGAEMSLHCVITNEKTHQKFATHYDFHFSAFSIIDPELHCTVPRYLTACGMCDTITHVAENYFAGDNNTPLTNRIAEGVVQTVIENENALDKPEDLELRGNLAWAATIAINGLTDCGRGAFYYGAHTIEHAVSGIFDVTHGAGLAVIHPAWLEYLCDQDPAKFVTFAKRVFGIQDSGKSDMEIGKAGIKTLKEKYQSWGLPVTLAELNISNEAFDKIATAVIADPDSPIEDKAIVIDVLQRCKQHTADMSALLGAEKDFNNLARQVEIVREAQESGEQ